MPYGTDSFRGKNIFITGAGQGFGRDFAHAFAAAGAAIAVTDIDLEKAEATAQKIVATGTRAIAIACDVADEVAVNAAAKEAAENLGGIDILINNAGRHMPESNRPFTVMTSDDIRGLFDVNILGVIYCTRACWPYMRDRGGGAVINISSIAGHWASTPYGVSKLAVRGLTIAFASELAKDRIRVNAISPGLILTETVAEEIPEEMLAKFRDEHQLIDRQGEMSDITSTALYLCSDDASFITGETIKVAGGYPLHI